MLPEEVVPGRWLAPLRRQPAGLVPPPLLSKVRCTGRLLSQATSQGLLSFLPTLLHLGAAGNLLSPEQRRPGLSTAALAPNGSGTIRHKEWDQTLTRSV